MKYSSSKLRFQIKNQKNNIKNRKNRQINQKLKIRRL